jgi:NAD(P)-dependent dehydrogenase (short-subunit alcohol dehydrogenase family)
MFTGKVIIVTGAAGNVGRAVASLLAERGARVAAVDMVAEPLAGIVGSLAGEAGRHVALPAVDLADPASCTTLVEEVQQALGRLDGVVTTVGGFAMGPLEQVGPDDWDRLFALNVRTTWNIYRAAVPAVRATGGGSLVGIGSVAGLHAGAQMAAYAASKAAVMRMTESLADELRGDRIRVNAVLPTTIDTPQNRAAMPGADTSRWVKPSEVAEAILFLLSDAASAVSGALLQVG